MTNSADTHIQYDDVCWWCDGTGFADDLEDDTIVCPECDGIGYLEYNQ